MPILDQAQSDQLAERRGTNAHVLLWVIARNRDTGGDAPIGFWTGDDTQVFQIGAEQRTYHGAGNVIDVAPVVAEIGMKLRYHRITLTLGTSEVLAMFRQYEARRARVELHVCLLDIDTGALLGTPKRMIRGRVNKLVEEIGAKGATSGLEMVITSNALTLTTALPLLRSNEELQRRNPADLGREYSDIAGEWVV